MAHAFYTKYWATLSSSINLVAISFLTKRLMAMLKSNVEQCFLRLQEFWAMSFLKKNAGNECLADLLCLPEFWCQCLFSQRYWWQSWRWMLSHAFYVFQNFVCLCFPHKAVGNKVQGKCWAMLSLSSSIFVAISCLTNRSLRISKDSPVCSPIYTSLD